jgi:cytoskeletal protein RodZ
VKTSSKKRYSLAALLLLLIKAKAWLTECLLLMVVATVVLGSIIAVAHVAFPETPQNNPNPTNSVSIDPYSTVYEYVYLDNYPVSSVDSAQSQVQSFKQPSTLFTFQYGFCSTNSISPVWSKVSTNLTITKCWPNDDPIGSNNINWQLTNQSYVAESIVATPINTSNCYDIIYQEWGWLYHMQNTNVGGTYVTVFNTNLTLIVSSSPDMVNWSPVFTNSMVGLDIPYTFSDSQAMIPNKFYRVQAY